MAKQKKAKKKNKKKTNYSVGSLVDPPLKQVTVDVDDGGQGEDDFDDSVYTAVNKITLRFETNQGACILPVTITFDDADLNPIFINLSNGKCKRSKKKGEYIYKIFYKLKDYRPSEKIGNNNKGNLSWTPTQTGISIPIERI